MGFTMRWVGSQPIGSEGGDRVSTWHIPLQYVFVVLMA